jgi:hypothetical protein
MAVGEDVCRHDEAVPDDGFGSEQAAIDDGRGGLDDDIGDGRGEATFDGRCLGHRAECYWAGEPVSAILAVVPS